MRYPQISSSLRFSDTFFSSQLFHDVQMHKLFGDSKVFADARALSDIDDIVKLYEVSGIPSSGSNFKEALRTFVHEHFEIPKTPDVKNTAANGVRDYIDTLWVTLQRQPDQTNDDSLLPLPNPYIVPGGRFQEIYYWDSYFTAVGLMQAGQRDIVCSMIDNFIVLLRSTGKIPNGNRSYYVSRSQPPVLALMVELVLKGMEQQAKVDFLKTRFDALQLEYQFWMTGEDDLTPDQPTSKRLVLMPDNSILNRYWDDEATPRPESYQEDKEATKHFSEEEAKRYCRNIRAACESGWDFSSRWLADPNDLLSIETTDIVPVDLNCLLFKTECLLGEFAKLLEDHALSNRFRDKASKRHAAIDTYLWDDTLGFYFDFHIKRKQASQIWSLASACALFCQSASAQQAEKVLKHVETKFLKRGGLITSLSKTKQQWDSPNGWAPLQWFAVTGCLNYQHPLLAEKIMRAWLLSIESYFTSHRCLMEKYNVEHPEAAATGGEYEVQEGFGWSNGITLAFYHLLDEQD